MHYLRLGFASIQRKHLRFPFFGIFIVVTLLAATQCVAQYNTYQEFLHYPFSSDLDIVDHNYNITSWHEISTTISKIPNVDTCDNFENAFNLAIHNDSITFTSNTSAHFLGVSQIDFWNRSRNVGVVTILDDNTSLPWEGFLQGPDYILPVYVQYKFAQKYDLNVGDLTNVTLFDPNTWNQVPPMITLVLLIRGIYSVLDEPQFGSYWEKHRENYTVTILDYGVQEELIFFKNFYSTEQEWDSGFFISSQGIIEYLSQNVIQDTDQVVFLKDGDKPSDYAKYFKNSKLESTFLIKYISSVIDGRNGPDTEAIETSTINYIKLMIPESNFITIRSRSQDWDKLNAYISKFLEATYYSSLPLIGFLIVGYAILQNQFWTENFKFMRLLEEKEFSARDQWKVLIGQSIFICGVTAVISYFIATLIFIVFGVFAGNNFIYFGWNTFLSFDWVFVILLVILQVLITVLKISRDFLRKRKLHGLDIMLLDAHKSNYSSWSPRKYLIVSGACFGILLVLFLNINGVYDIITYLVPGGVESPSLREWVKIFSISGILIGIAFVSFELIYKGIQMVVVQLKRRSKTPKRTLFWSLWEQNSRQKNPFLVIFIVVNLFCFNLLGLYYQVKNNSMHNQEAYKLINFGDKAIHIAFRGNTSWTMEDASNYLLLDSYFKDEVPIISCPLAGSAGFIRYYLDLYVINKSSYLGWLASISQSPQWDTSKMMELVEGLQDSESNPILVDDYLFNKGFCLNDSFSIFADSGTQVQFNLAGRFEILPGVDRNPNDPSAVMLYETFLRLNLTPSSFQFYGNLATNATRGTIKEHFDALKNDPTFHGFTLDYHFNEDIYGPGGSAENLPITRVSPLMDMLQILLAFQWICLGLCIPILYLGFFKQRIQTYRTHFVPPASVMQAITSSWGVTLLFSASIGIITLVSLFPLIQDIMNSYISIMERILFIIGLQGHISSVYTLPSDQILPAPLLLQGFSVYSIIGAILIILFIGRIRLHENTRVTKREEILNE